VSLSTVTAVIPGTGSVSAGVQVATQGLVGVYFPGDFANAPLSFLVSLDRTTWLVLRDQYGNEVAIPSAAGEQIGLDPDDFVGYTNIKVRSGTSDNPVTQPSDAPVALITLGTTPPLEPVQPNPRRTIYIEPECQLPLVGTFTPYWSTEDDVATFDLTFILATGETVTNITEFDLTPEGPGSVTDPTPADRILGTATITGTQVSQRFGNWQQDIVQILYRVNMTCLTSFDNTISVYAYVWVNQPPSTSCGC
jgi:hypothetical protein